MNMPILKKWPGAADILVSLCTVAPENPRSGETLDALALTALADNMQALGILTPLIGYKDGRRIMITAGGRRLRAACDLIQRSEWDVNATLPVVVLDKEDAITKGNAEQLSHQIMSDLDTLRVFALPAYEHWTDKELASLVGRSVAFVTQRRAILALPDAITTALLEGKITVSQAAGLTYWSDDEEGLANQFERCMNDRRWDGDDIRNAFSREAQAWDKSALARLITQEAYLEAGGKLQKDLFADTAFILSPSILEELALQAAHAKVVKENPDALFVEYTENQPYQRIWNGMDRLTEAEAEEWDDIHYHYSDYDVPDDVREQIRAEEENPEDALKAYERWLELSDKADMRIPPEAVPMLGVWWKVNKYARPNDDPIQIRHGILPEDMEPLYEAGFIDRPAPQDEAGDTTPASDGEPDPDALSAALTARIKRIYAHCERQEWIKKPNDVLALYLKSITTPSYGAATFSYQMEPTHNLNEDDPVPMHSKQMEKAILLLDTDVDAMTPVQQRTALACRLLRNLTTYKRTMDITPQNLREYVCLEAAFFKGYKKPQMIAMLAEIEGKPADVYQSIKVMALAERLATLFTEQTDWLPIGF